MCGILARNKTSRYKTRHWITKHTQNSPMIKRDLLHFPGLTRTHHLAGPLTVSDRPRRSCDRGDVGLQTKAFSYASLPSLSVSEPAHLPENQPNYQTEYTDTHAQTLPSVLPPLSSRRSLNLRDSNESILGRKHRLWSVFFLIRSFQIKGGFVFTNKSTGSPRQSANIRGEKKRAFWDPFV